MTFAVRRAAQDDYDVLQDGEIVERIYRMKADRELRRWMPPIAGAIARPQRRRGR